MNKRNFYLTAVKLIGAYLFIYSAYDLISLSAFAIQPWSDDQFLYSILYIVYAILPLLLSILIINKAGHIVEMLRLHDEEKESKVNLGRWDSKAIAELAILLLGGYLIIYNIVPFCVGCITHFADLVSVKYPYNPNPVEVRYTSDYDFISSAVSIFLGYLMITNFGWLVNKVVATDSPDEDAR